MSESGCADRELHLAVQGALRASSLGGHLVSEMASSRQLLDFASRLASECEKRGLPFGGGADCCERDAGGLTDEERGWVVESLRAADRDFVPDYEAEQEAPDDRVIALFVRELDLFAAELLGRARAASSGCVFDCANRLAEELGKCAEMDRGYRAGKEACRLAFAGAEFLGSPSTPGTFWQLSVRLAGGDGFSMLCRDLGTLESVRERWRAYVDAPDGAKGERVLTVTGLVCDTADRASREEDIDLELVAGMTLVQQYGDAL